MKTLKLAVRVLKCFNSSVKVSNRNRRRRRFRSLIIPHEDGGKSTRKILYKKANYNFYRN